MKQFSDHSLLYTGTLLIASACSGSDFVTKEPLHGTYPLVEYEGKSIPADLGTLPSRVGERERCNLILQDGKLVLNSTKGVYNREQVYINSCTSVVLSTQHVEGSYREQDDKLILLVRRKSPPLEVEHIGVIEEERIVLTVTAPTSPSSVLIYDR